MPSLQVRELPDNIYHLLQKRAQADHRSLAQEAVAILAKGLDISMSNKERRVSLLREIGEKTLLGDTKKFDPVEFIREDRSR